MDNQRYAELRINALASRISSMELKFNKLFNEFPRDLKESCVGGFKELELAAVSGIQGAGQ